MEKVLYGVAKTGKILQWSIKTEGDTIYVTHGQLGGKMQTKTTVCKPKNVGKVNETTGETQAITEAISKINKQIDKCYCDTPEKALDIGDKLPMLAHDYTKQGHRIKFPCYVSTKLDGLRCIADIKNEEVTLTSRGGKTYPCPEFLKKELVTLSLASGINKFDGELYIHGMSLQNIVSCAKKENENTPLLKYYIFDVPSKKVWEDRNEDLKNIGKILRLDHINFVPNTLVHSEQDAKIFLNRFIMEGFEGLMLRNINGLYEFNHRSADLQKWKLMQDSEALVLSVKKDKNGEGVLNCAMKEDRTKEFECKMKGNADFRAYQEQLKLVGKWITYKFQTHTDDGKPQFPVGLLVRECDENGEPLE